MIYCNTSIPYHIISYYIILYYIVLYYIILYHAFMIIIIHMPIQLPFLYLCLSSSTTTSTTSSTTTSTPSTLSPTTSTTSRREGWHSVGRGGVPCNLSYNSYLDIATIKLNTGYALPSRYLIPAK